MVIGSWFITLGRDTQPTDTGRKSLRLSVKVGDLVKVSGYGIDRYPYHDRNGLIIEILSPSYIRIRTLSGWVVDYPIKDTEVISESR